VSEQGLVDQIPLFGESSWKSKCIFLGALFFLGVLIAVYSDYNLQTGSGNLTMALFVTANIYYPAKRIRIHYNVRNVQLFFNKILVYHIWLNTASFIVACFHCYITLWSNNWLMLGLFLMGWLTIGGFLMWIKYQPSRLKKGVYLLHTQQVVFLLLVFTMLKGHYIF